MGSEKRIFLTGTLAGVPMVWCGWSLGACLARKALATESWPLVGLGLVATVAIAVSWVWLDRKSMAAIEHYGWEGWELVVMIGTYGAAVLWGLGCVTLRAYRLVRRQAF